MTRSRWMILASALAACTTGCAHCDNCDDIPVACYGPNCGAAPNVAPGPISGPVAPGPTREPIAPPSGTSVEVPTIVPPSLPEIPAEPTTPPPAPPAADKPTE